MSCERCRDMMVEALYGELDPAAQREFEAHVDGCTECAALHREMRTTMSAMNERRRPEPDEGYWETYYARLEARMSREQSVVDGAKFTARRRSNVSWGYRVAAAVAVLALGVWIGRSTLGPGTPGERNVTITQNTPADTIRDRNAPADTARGADNDRDTPGREAIEGPATRGTRAPGNGKIQLASADVRAREYIERSQVLLLALVNATPDTSAAAVSDFDTRRRRAGMLVREASTLRDELPGSENRRMRELVTDLQLILREIANLENEKDLDGVQIIRNRVDREGVLLQIDVQQMSDEGKGAPAQKSGAID
ncbi:MAG TPA: zf-HC2 domain-containing protein [Candidatus Krumholzibacteria bacterium]